MTLMTKSKYCAHISSTSLITCFLILSNLSEYYIFEAKQVSLKNTSVVALICIEFCCVYLLLWSGLKLNNFNISKSILFKAILAGTSKL